MHRMTKKAKARRNYAVIYFADPTNRMRQLTTLAAHRARRAKLDFSKTLRDVLMAQPPDKCACCHCNLDYSLGRGVSNRDKSPSLDRVNNSLGYTLDNTAVICMRCNRHKSDSTIKELELIIQYMRGYHK